MRRFRAKKDWILPYVAEKKVLDLGCVDHNLDKTQNANWLHALICEQATMVLGVDYLQEEVTVLQQKGYNVICTNVETMTLDDQFDVIVAGDILEHLSNCGLFLDRIFEHLAPDGVLLVTTPNPVHFLKFIQVLFLGNVYDNKEHTCYFTPQVLKELASRSCLRIIETAFVDDTYQYHRHRIWYLWPLLLANFGLCILRPQFSQTQCFALKKY